MCVGVVKTPRSQGGALASDAMLESVMIIRLATGAMVEVVVPFGVSKGVDLLLLSSWKTAAS